MTAFEIVSYIDIAGNYVNKEKKEINSEVWKFLASDSELTWFEGCKGQSVKETRNSKPTYSIVAKIYSHLFIF